MVEPIASTHTAQDVRPLVGYPSGNRSVWIFAAILLAAGGGLFYAMQTQRLAQSNSALSPQVPDAGEFITSPPALVIPPAPAFTVQQAALPPTLATTPLTPSPQRATYSPPPISAEYEPAATVARTTPVQVPPAPEGPRFAYQAPAVSPSPLPSIAATKVADGRVEARAFKNPGTTVPQGSVLQAVMETALDSTRAGFARAIVSRDVESFDGTQVLIPRGSRLFGEYASDVSLGQKRALIQWKRLTRPDGTIIDLDSPSADPLGRAGVKGKVNTHFLQRFSGAIMQSFLDAGVRVATQKASNDTVIVGLSNSVSGTTTGQSSSDIKPTLKIAQGASVSVFVARDLDFSAVEH